MVRSKEYEFLGDHGLHPIQNCLTKISKQTYVRTLVPDRSMSGQKLSLLVIPDILEIRLNQNVVFLNKLIFFNIFSVNESLKYLKRPSSLAGS